MPKPANRVSIPAIKSKDSWCLEKDASDWWTSLAVFLNPVAALTCSKYDTCPDTRFWQHSGGMLAHSSWTKTYIHGIFPGLHGAATFFKTPPKKFYWIQVKCMAAMLDDATFLLKTSLGRIRTSPDHCPFGMSNDAQKVCEEAPHTCKHIFFKDFLIWQTPSFPLHSVSRVCRSKAAAAHHMTKAMLLLRCPFRHSIYSYFRYTADYLAQKVTVWFHYSRELHPKSSCVWPWWLWVTGANRLGPNRKNFGTLL